MFELQFADFRQYIADISSKKRLCKKPRRAFNRARKELHNDTNDDFNRRIQRAKGVDDRLNFLPCNCKARSIWPISLQKNAYFKKIELNEPVGGILDQTAKN